jgi:hypothetical protein
LKSVYQQTFAPERIIVDDKIDSYFDEIVNGGKMPPKFRHFLALFDLADSPESRETFFDFCKENSIRL